MTSLTPVNAHRCFSHDGVWQGFSTQIDRFVDDKLTVIVLTNLAWANVRAISRQIAAEYIPEMAAIQTMNFAELSPDVASQGWGQLHLPTSLPSAWANAFRLFGANQRPEIQRRNSSSITAPPIFPFVFKFPERREYCRSASRCDRACRGLP